MGLGIWDILGTEQQIYLFLLGWRESLLFSTKMYQAIVRFLYFKSVQILGHLLDIVISNKIQDTSHSISDTKFIVKYYSYLCKNNV